MATRARSTLLRSLSLLTTVKACHRLTSFFSASDGSPPPTGRSTRLPAGVTVSTWKRRLRSLAACTVHPTSMLLLSSNWDLCAVGSVRFICSAYACAAGLESSSVILFSRLLIASCVKAVTSTRIVGRTVEPSAWRSSLQISAAEK